MAKHRTGRTLPAVAMSMAIMAISISGCAGGNPFASYDIAADDPCGAQRQQLKSFQDFFFASMVEGAAIGAVAGGLAGYLAGQNTQSTLIGAGAGALVGGVGGYFLAKEKANNDPAAVEGAVYKDVSTENQKIDGVSVAFRAIRDCRVKSAQAVKRDYRAKRISLDEAQAGLAKVKSLFQEDITFADSLGAKMSQRGEEYADASNKLDTIDPNAKRERAARRQPSGGAASGPVAVSASRVHSDPSASSPQVASLAAGQSVTVLDQGDTPSDWMHIQTGDGKSGYVVSRLISTSGGASARSGGPPPKVDAAGVAQLTDTNQLKRRGLTNQVAEAKNEANGGTFELNGNISRLPPRWIFRWAA